MDIVWDDYLIHKFKIKNWSETKIKLLDVYTKSTKNLYGNVITNWDRTEKSREFIQDVIHILKEDIELFKIKYEVEYEVIDIWFQEYENKMDHGIHDHGLYGYSSVIYVEYDPKEHTPTTFVNTKTNKSFKPEVEEGDIIFFRSNCKHCCPPNKSDKKRLICSFNLKPDKTDNFSY